MVPSVLQKLRSIASAHRGSLALLGAAVPLSCTKGNAPEPARDTDSSAQAMAEQDASADALAEMFRDGSPEDVATALEAMIDTGPDAAGDASREAGAADAGKPRSVNPVRPRPTTDGTRGAPIYKGVVF